MTGSMPPVVPSKGMENWVSSLPKRLFPGAPNSVSSPDCFTGSTGFLRACEEDNYGALDKLLVSSKSDSPPLQDMLITAARSQSLNILRRLLDPQRRGTYLEMSPTLHKAACQGGKDVYAIFLSFYPSMLSLSLDDLGGPIPHAILENDALFLYYLLQQGFDSTCLDNLKNPPHSQSLQDVDPEVVDLLAEFRLSLEGTNAPPQGSSPKDFDYRLQHGIDKKRPSVLRYLLSRNPDWKMPEMSWIYRTAAVYAKLPTFAAFIEHEPDLLDPERIHYFEICHIWNVMSMAISQNDVPYVKWLMDHGADPNKCYHGGESVLSYAKSKDGAEQMIELLESYGATVHEEED